MFLVVDKIIVYFKVVLGDDDKMWVWEFEINVSLYIVKESEEVIVCGIKIVLYFKEGCEEFFIGEKLSSFVKTYSEFIFFFIDVWVKMIKEKEVEDKVFIDVLKEVWEKKKIEVEVKGEEFIESEFKFVKKKEFE